MTQTELQKYSAKLLFQFRVVVGGESNKRRTCEERIVLIRATCAQDALAQAKAIGAASEHDYKNSDYNQVFFEFVGIMDLMHLGVECEENEVWYEIKEYLNPKERSDKLLPQENMLSAIRNEGSN